MPFVKVQKNKAYYKRIQTKFRRRREGKTDYFARRKMITQCKNKYNSPKYRLVVRRTNTKIICQVVYATIQGDRVLTQATSKELTKFGIPSGHTNYAACYATGLLIARRCLKVVGLDQAIEGYTEGDAAEFHVEDEEIEALGERRPFKVILDLGLGRTITGCRYFGVLKGAVDGGLLIPHKVRKFPGYEQGENKGDYEYDASLHREKIMGGHVQEYMENLKEEDPERYQQVFKGFIEADHEDDLEDMYTESHEKIRENPEFEKTPKSDIVNTRNGNKISTSKGNSYVRKIKITKKQRAGRVAQKFAAARKKLLAMHDDDDDE